MSDLFEQVVKKNAELALSVRLNDAFEGIECSIKDVLGVQDVKNANNPHISARVLGLMNKLEGIKKEIHEYLLPIAIDNMRQNTIQEFEKAIKSTFGTIHKEQDQ